MNVKLLDLQAQYLTIRAEIRRAIDEVCDSQQLILGPHVEKFEKSLAEYCGTKHAIGVSSGTDALLCALMGIGIRPGDEVICPSFTFFATAGSIARLGAKPVFVDVEPGSFNINPGLIEAKISKNTKAIMPVHLFGQVAKMEAINEIGSVLQPGSARNEQLEKLRELTDTDLKERRTRMAVNGVPACAWGFAGCLSFYPTKNLGAFGDAGAICTNDDKFAEICRKLRVHGSGHTYHHEMIGGMFRIAALQAAVLSVKLKYLEQWHEARRRNAAIYDSMFKGTKVVSPRIDDGNRSIYNQYVIRVPDRDRVKQALADKGVGTAIYYPLPLHLQPCFRELGYRQGDLPETERACREVLAMPIYPELEEHQVRHVGEQLVALVQ